jgi:hypothetical protein
LPAVLPRVGRTITAVEVAVEQIGIVVGDTSM